MRTASILCGPRSLSASLKLPTKRAYLFFLLLLLGTLAHLDAQSLPSSITVRLFTAHPASSLSITPYGVQTTIKNCASCLVKPLSEALQMDLSHAALVLRDPKNASTSTSQVTINGSLQIVASNPERRIHASGIWIMKAEQDGIKVLLTIPLERYVAFALNGEAAPDEPQESLRALAIALRTYATTNQHRHAAEGFDLCDSTHCQSLRIDKTREAVEQAVLDTTGVTLWKDSRRASIYYSQNCGGRTESAHALWPQEQAHYLTTHADPFCVRAAPAQWHAQIPIDRFREAMLRQGWRTPPSIESIRILNRSESGRALLLEITGSGEHVQVTASSLRFALDRDLGWNQLRSDGYEVAVSGGAVRFDGKGYGHGVGLCQAGAHQMALEHNTARDILGFYFPGTRLSITGNDSGWMESSGSGWTLRTTGDATFLLDAGNHAWAEAQEKAHALLGASVAMHPTVYAFPTTDLFRQATSEPGWVRASSRADHIFLQPVDLLNRQQGAEATLLHEFLHLLIEQAANPKAPLWLREGLVEALAEPTGMAPAISRFSLDSINAGLIDRNNATASQRAHDNAKTLVQSLLERYGKSTVSAWLRNGVPPNAIIF